MMFEGFAGAAASGRLREDDFKRDFTTTKGRHTPLRRTRRLEDHAGAELVERKYLELLIGAEYGCGVHRAPPSFAGTYAKRSMRGPLFSLQANDTTI